MNIHDSEKMAGIFSESGFESTDRTDNADVIVLNTCSIREKAEQKVYSELGRLEKMKKTNPGLKIAVAGCIAQQKGSSLFKRFPCVDFVLGPNNIDSLSEWINGQSKQTDHWSVVSGQKSVATDYGQPATDNKQQTVLLSSRITALQDNPDYHTMTLPMKREGRVKAWVSIMYGCDNFCAYCVVPYTRGRERSRPSQDILTEVRDIADKGFKEVTLLGQNVNSYGRKLDGNIDFPDLLKVIHEVPGIERIRFVTSHPRDLSDKLIEAMKDLPKVCEHLHLPLQSGSDKVLRQMNRGYTYQEYKEKISLLRNAVPDIAITTDIITGFPGETEADFECTINALKEIKYDGIFAFKYSKRPGTKALELSGHVDEKVKSQRLSDILELQGEITFNKNKTLEGKTLEVLVEGPGDSDEDDLTGRTRTNKIVFFKGTPQDIGHVVQVKINKAMQHSVFGEVESSECGIRSAECARRTS